MSDCYQCKNRREVPHNSHSRCIKPDPDMVGKPEGVKNFWFIYPMNFDPIWIDKKCVNFEEIAK